MQSSTVLLGYFWPISSTTVLASAGKYRIVSVGNGTAAEDDNEGSSSNILPQLPDCTYIMISKTDLYSVTLYNVISCTPSKTLTKNKRFPSSYFSRDFICRYISLMHLSACRVQPWNYFSVSIWRFIMWCNPCNVLQYTIHSLTVSADQQATMLIRSQKTQVSYEKLSPILQWSRRS